MALVNQAVQDGIGKRRFAEIGVPGVHRQLAGDQCGSGVHAVIEDFQQVGPVLRAERGKPPVIEHDQGSFRERLEELDVATIAVRDA